MGKFQKPLLLIFCAFGFTVQANAHPIKMTTGKLQIDSKNKSCGLVLNFFIDDFEGVLRELYPQPAFNYEKPAEMMLETINGYILQNFALTIDDISVPLKLESVSKIEENVCQIKMSSDLQNLNSFSVVFIKNTLLFSSFDKQSNILHLFLNDEGPRILQFFEKAPVRIEKF